MDKKLHPIISELIGIRKDKKLSQERLVNQSNSNIAQNQISSYERGAISPTLRLLTQWSNALGYELALRRIEEK